MYGKLNDAQRQAILTKIADAPDACLLIYAEHLHTYYGETHSKLRVVCEWLDVKLMDIPTHIDKAIDAAIKPQQDVKSKPDMPSYATPVKPTPLKSVKPKAEPASKIGAETKTVIMERLRKMPHTADEINSALRRGDARLEETEGLLALLHKRGEVLYDGEMYRLGE